MANKTWMNFGGIRITDGVSVADFPGATGLITFTPYQPELISDNGYLVSRLMWYRVEIDLEKLYTLQNDPDAVTYTKKLASILSNLVSPSYQKTATIYPRFDPDEDVNLSYECVLGSSIAPKDVARVECGTVLGLSWKAIAPVVTIPSIFSGESEETYANASGSEYVNQDGDNYTKAE